MALRANWKGYLRLSLVSCAVALYPATVSASRLKCHTINRKTGNRINEVVVDALTREPVEREDRVKGCEVAKDDYVAVDEAELAKIKLESTHTINLESFVERDAVDERYLEKPYYLAPEDRVSREAFSVIRDAMGETGKAGLGRLVIYKRERIVLLEPFEQGMLATLLRYHDEIRSPTAYFEAIGDFAAPPDMRSLALQLIERNSAPFDPSRFADRYEDALIALVQAKAQGRGASKGAKAAKAEPKTSNVVNLMEALKRSLAAEKATAPAKTAARKATGPATTAARKAKASSESAKSATKPPARSRAKEAPPLKRAS